MMLFDTDETIALRDGELRYWPVFLDSGQSAALRLVLRRDTPWVQSRIRIAGKSIPIPRLNAWYGDRGVEYGYSGVRLATEPWTAELAALKRRIEAATGLGFNSALVNFYRNGADSVDWHSDDERELGAAPQVASLSLGAVRRFELKHRTIPSERCHLDLPDGSLLLMAGDLQHHWRHRVPKQPGVTGERINITFRTVQEVI